MGLLPLLSMRGGLNYTPRHLSRGVEGGRCAMVLIRQEGIIFKAVSPERRRELLAMGMGEHG